MLSNLLLATLILLTVQRKSEGQGNTTFGPGDLVSFGNLSLFHLNSYELNHAQCIIEDKRSKGSFIIAERTAISLVSRDGSVTLFMGDPLESGYAPGKYFSEINSIHQLSTYDIIVSDKSCIRKITIKDKNDTVIAGRCAEGGQTSGTTVAKNARFKYIVECVITESEKIFYYLEHEDTKIYKHDLENNTVEVIFSPNNLKFASSFVVDSGWKNFYISHSNGITKFDLSLRNYTLISGTIDRTLFDKSEDGTLLSARYKYVATMKWLLQDQVLVLAEQYSDTIRVANLIDDTVTRICQSKQERGGEAERGGKRITYELGGQDKCKVYQPYSLAVIGGKVYIGMKSMLTRSREKHDFLTLDFSVQTNDSSKRTNGSYSPNIHRPSYSDNTTGKSGAKKCELDIGLMLGLIFGLTVCDKFLFLLPVFPGILNILKIY